MVPARALRARIVQRAAVVALALLLSACGGSRDGDSGEGVPQAAADPAFVAENEAWRAQRRAELLQPDGWASLIGLHWLELPAHYVGSGAGNGIRLARGPEKLGLLQQQGGRVWLTPDPDTVLAVDGVPVKGRVELRSDQTGAPTLVAFDEGRGQLSLVERAGRKALRVKHAQADTLTGLGPLDYWPADPAWRVQARFIAHPPGKTIEIMDITSRQAAQPNPGLVEFEHGGARYRLEALEGEAGGLFLVFADRTSGHDSYGAGRYLYTEAPGVDGVVAVDFNRAYNPPCVFTDFATCPLPPPENRLDLAVTAGEKKYARPEALAGRWWPGQGPRPWPAGSGRVGSHPVPATLACPVGGGHLLASTRVPVTVGHNKRRHDAISPQSRPPAPLRTGACRLRSVRSGPCR